ncbi:MAG: DUF255 domain-containing protein [Bacillota bacterium]|nr:DUF255 domain-containing protein [Bacillota bacterium]
MSRSSGRIAWRDWSAAALAEASRSGRPIFLVVAPAWSESAHRFDETVLSDPAVQAVLAESFLPVRVDPDERPDLDARYNLGGWPSVAVLAPSGDLLAAAGVADGSRLAGHLRGLAGQWRLRRPLLERQIGRYRLPERLPELLVEPGAAWLEQLEALLLRHYDPEHAGFGGAPKFLPLEPLEALAAFAPGELAEPLRPLLPATLAALLRSPLRDPRGGFRRLAAEADWSDPAGERLLADNARLLALLAPLSRPESGWRARLEAAGLAAAEVAEAAEGQVRFLASLERVEGGWASAFDATPAPAGEARPVGPVAVGPSSLAARALLEAAAGPGEAEAALRFLRRLDRMLPGGPAAAPALPRRLDRPGPLRGYLGDLVPLGRAFLAAWEATGEAAWLRRSLELAAGALATLAGESGALADLPQEEAEALGLRRAAAYPGPNAEAALWLLLLAEAQARGASPGRGGGATALPELPAPARLLEAARAILAWGLPFAPTSGWQGAAWYRPLRLYLRLTEGEASSPEP